MATFDSYPAAKFDSHPTKGDESVLAVSRVIRNRTARCEVNVGREFSLPDSPTDLDEGTQAGLMGIADGDTLAVLDILQEWVATWQPISGRYGWAPRPEPVEVQTVEQRRVCWPKKGRPRWI